MTWGVSHAGVLTLNGIILGTTAGAVVDMIISNCVINLSPDKPAVLREAHRVLANGGEFYFSDVYCDRRLPEDLRSHEILLGECLGGANLAELLAEAELAIEGLLLFGSRGVGDEGQ